VERDIPLSTPTFNKSIHNNNGHTMKKSFDDVIEEIFQLFDKSRPKVIHHKTRYIKQIGMRTKQREVLTRSEVNKYLYRLDSERKRKEKEKDK
jgi:hypothetical protein